MEVLPPGTCLDNLLDPTQIEHLAAAAVSALVPFGTPTLLSFYKHIFEFEVVIART